MLLDSITNTPAGVYTSSAIAGLLVGILLADSSFPVNRWLPKLTAIGGVGFYTLYAFAVVEIAPLSAPIFALACTIARCVCTACLLKNDPSISHLTFVDRLRLSVKVQYRPPHP